MVQRLAPWGVNFLVYHTRVEKTWPEAGIKFVDLDTLSGISDVVMLHVPLTEKNRNLLDAEKIGKMKSTAYLVNTSRGGIVNEQALADAVGEGRIAGAALDVYQQEPLPADSPLRRIDPA